MPKKLAIFDAFEILNRIQEEENLLEGKTPEEAKAKLKSVSIPNDNPENLEEWILSQVGEDIYNTFVKGYTTKQWGKSPKELPTFIIKRLPIRTSFDDNYYFDNYQGIPIGGYTKIFEKLLDKDKQVTFATKLTEKFLKSTTIDFIKKNDMITIPPLAEETWRMIMMTPKQQLVSPFFLGGETLMISYPTDEMDDDAKLMSMRGNNPHFSRSTVHHELIAGHHLEGFMNDRYKSYRSFETPFWTDGFIKDHVGYVNDPYYFYFEVYKALCSSLILVGLFDRLFLL